MAALGIRPARTPTLNFLGRDVCSAGVSPAFFLHVGDSENCWRDACATKHCERYCFRLRSVYPKGGKRLDAVLVNLAATL
jgi:hypothetical protein